MKDQVSLSDKTKLSMPIANLIGLIMIVASVVFMYSRNNWATYKFRNFKRII